MPPAEILRCEGEILDVREHHRTIRGRRALDGSAITDSINLGWFIHLTISNGYGPFAFGGFATRPDVKVGDRILVTLRKLEG